jgi:hypothetical protein
VLATKEWVDEGIGTQGREAQAVSGSLRLGRQDETMIR